MPATPSALQDALRTIAEEPRRWLVTGAAGFIGSNLVETLLKLHQPVVGLDNFATGRRANLDSVRDSMTPQQWERFHFIEGDIRDAATCATVCKDVDIVLHQAALGSVPRSLADPLATHAANVTGFINMLASARDANVKRFVYAASSSTYGDHPALPKVESQIGSPLSPYAATKLMDEIYAQVFSRCYGLPAIGLRYFNVFGPRQDPDGAYAAVIPRWINAMMHGDAVTIHGDGETSRDFCYIDNVIQANLLAATVSRGDAVNQIYNVAYGERTTLNQLFGVLKVAVTERVPAAPQQSPRYGPERAGDVRHSLADISKARTMLGYEPAVSPQAGLLRTVDWFAAVERVTVSAVPNAAITRN